MRRYANRAEAGRELATMLGAFSGRPDVIVLALPRGGVPVAFEIAEALDAPLDVFIVRKLGAPANEEYAIGAIATGGITVIDRHAASALGVSGPTLEALVARERRELARRERLYRGDRAMLPVVGRTVIVVDDGLATGATMQAAVAALRTQNPAHIIVAAPVGSREACAAIRNVADDCLCRLVPLDLYGVGYWYEDFSQTSDREVLDLLQRAAHRPAAGATSARSGA